MPVNSTHPDYDLRISDWRKCRDAFEGEAAIKAAGPAYLPRASGLSTEEYNAYKERALFYSITNKSVSALAGMATPKSMARSDSTNQSVQHSELLHIFTSRPHLICLF